MADVKRAELRKGLTFKNEKAIEVFMKEYQNDQKTVFVRGRTINLATLKLKNTSNSNLIYYQLEYRCKFGPKRKSVSAGERRARTFKRDCDAFVTFKINHTRSAYMIVNFNNHHMNHEGSQKYFGHEPEMRRLDNEEKDFALQALELGCKPARLQLKLTEMSKKAIRAKDLLNLAAATKSQDDENISKVKKVLENNYDATVHVLHEENVFEGLYFSTKEMRENMKKFPEIVFIDGTYKLFKKKYTLMLMVIEDGEGRSKVVAVGILANETRPVLKWLLECFKYDNKQACSNIKGFMSDKDMVERSVIKEVFKNVPLFICQFHALRTFGREICVTKMSITKKEREDALYLIDKMVKSSNEDEYERYYTKFQESFTKDSNKCIIDYFDINWKPIKDEWTKYKIFHANFGNLTNNRIESINSKIKGFLSKYNSMLTFVKDFFRWNLHRNLEMNYKDIYFSLKVDAIPINRENSLEVIKNDYANLLTRYAYDHIVRQLQLLDFVTFRNIQESSQECTFTSNNEELLVSPYNCQCIDRVGMMLPCRHIFACRKHFQLPLFESNLCDNRWIKQSERIMTNSRVNVNNSENTMLLASTVSKIKAPKRLTIGEKRRKLKPIVDELMSIASEQTDIKFNKKLKELNDLLSKWKENTKENINHTITPLENSFENLTLEPEIVKDTNTSEFNIITPSAPKIIGRVSNALNCKIKIKRKNKSKT